MPLVDPADIDDADDVIRIINVKRVHIAQLAAEIQRQKNETIYQEEIINE